VVLELATPLTNWTHLNYGLLQPFIYYLP